MVLLLDEATSNTISLLFHELARHPEIQEKVRDEIFDTLAEVQMRGQSDLTFADMERMAYGLAFMKERVFCHFYREDSLL